MTAPAVPIPCKRAEIRGFFVLHGREDQLDRLAAADAVGVVEREQQRRLLGQHRDGVLELAGIVGRELQRNRGRLLRLPRPGLLLRLDGHGHQALVARGPNRQPAPPGKLHHARHRQRLRRPAGIGRILAVDVHCHDRRAIDDFDPQAADRVVAADHVEVDRVHHGGEGVRESLVVAAILRLARRAAVALAVHRRRLARRPPRGTRCRRGRAPGMSRSARATTV